jgi:hypothetical protein
MRYFKARYVGPPTQGTLMGETDDRTESEGKGVFIIRNGQKIAKYETDKWVPLLPGVVVRITPDGIKIEMAH